MAGAAARPQRGGSGCVSDRGRERVVARPLRGQGPRSQSRRGRVRNVCSAEACLSYAVAADERYGIWGGTLPEERRGIRWILDSQEAAAGVNGRRRPDAPGSGTGRSVPITARLVDCDAMTPGPGWLGRSERDGRPGCSPRAPT